MPSNRAAATCTSPRQPCSCVCHAAPDLRLSHGTRRRISEGDRDARAIDEGPLPTRYSCRIAGSIGKLPVRQTAEMWTFEGAHLEAFQELAFHQ